LEELNKRVTEVKELAEKSRDQIKELAGKSKDQLKDIVEERPLESSATIFFVGLVLGLLLGAAFSKRGQRT